MTHLSLSLLGTFQATIDGKPVTAFESDKVRALLAYLAVEAEQPHRRERLAGLFWPERPERCARQNLSQALFNLRCAISDREARPPFLRITHHTLQFNQAGDHSLDAATFTDLLAACEKHSHHRLTACDACMARLQRAATLYRGPFLEGFSLGDSPAFEEWALLQRERRRHLFAETLRHLADCFQQRGEYEAALPHVRRWVELDPWQEPARRQLMRLLALSGQRNAALAQYQICCRTLAKELGVEPEEETRRLYEQIRAGVLDAPVSLPSFLDDAENGTEAERPCFVARRRELTRLNSFLDTALAGQGRVVFVIGEAGSGKTALVNEFSCRALAAHTNLIVARGNGAAYTGIGDPYLPFREILGMLTGEAETRWLAGAISREYARRLWHTLPLTTQALLEAGPDLVGAFVSSPDLLRRARAYTSSCPGAETSAGMDWQGLLAELVERQTAAPETTTTRQRNLFEQYTRVLRALSRQISLLLVLDDLQWGDPGSISLLFHLGRQLANSPILIVGAYRPEEIAAGRNGERHPLEPVINEFRRDFGEISVDLSQAEGRKFVRALLDSEPNRLGPDFCETLYRQTGGHPLFTIELVRGLQERGDLAQDGEGQWAAGPTLDWDTLPARVEGAIAERIGRLSPPLREVLAVASVEGETFTAEVVARVSETDAGAMIKHLSGELDRKYRLVRAQRIQRINGQRLSMYRFRHHLFQAYLYHNLDDVERAHLHEAVGTALETLYDGRTEAVAVGLARHFEAADIPQKATEYLLEAGGRARKLYAYQEAIDYYQRALVILKEQGDYERAARTLMQLGLAYHNLFDFRRASLAYQEGFALRQRVGQARSVAPPPPAPHALRIVWHEPITLCPALAEHGFSAGVIRQIFSGLVTRGRKTEAAPDVARRWEILDEGRKYIFHLRDDVLWSDGTPVTACDFEYAWKRVLDPAANSPGASSLYDVKGARAFHQGEAAESDSVGVQALDNFTLVVMLEGPTGYFLHLMKDVATFPAPRHAIEKYGQAWADVENIVTNGPFRLETWIRGKAMVLSRNPTYHGRFRGNLKRVELSLTQDHWPPRVLDLYGDDELDAMSLPLPEVAKARQRRPEEFVSVPALLTTYAAFDVSRPPFNDRRVRQAFVLATNRERVAGEIYGGLVAPATGGFIPPGMPGHSAGIGLPYDPPWARRLLAEAGYPYGHNFPGVKGRTIDGAEAIAQFMQRLWRENLGVEVEWELLDDAALAESLKRELPPLYGLGWAADYPDPDSFLRVFFQRSPLNWHDEAFNKLVEEAHRTVDQQKRMKLYRQADLILVKEAPIMPIVYRTEHYLVKPWVRNYPAGSWDEVSWKDVIIEPH